MRIKINRSIVALLSVLALAMVVSACGDDGEPSGAGQPAGQTSDTTKGNATDLEFVAGMVPHHQSAIDMAQVALERGKSSFVKELAQDIVDSQMAELTTMQAADDRLASAGVKAGKPGAGHSSGMAEEEDPVEKLKTADPFDEAFIKEMLPHHKAALPMAQKELDKGGDAELKKVAQGIIDEQKREIAEMEKFAEEEFGSVPAAPAGEEEGGGHSG